MRYIKSNREATNLYIFLIDVEVVVRQTLQQVLLGCQ